jgi:hypothetical protein
VKLNRWNDFPKGVQRHLSERLLSRKITPDDLNRLRVWVESNPDVPETEWFKDFGSFKIVGDGPNPLSFLDAEQIPWGEEIPLNDAVDPTCAD